MLTILTTMYTPAIYANHDSDLQFARKHSKSYRRMKSNLPFRPQRAASCSTPFVDAWCRSARMPGLSRDHKGGLDA